MLDNTSIKEYKCFYKGKIMKTKSNLVRKEKKIILTMLAIFLCIAATIIFWSNMENYVASSFLKIFNKKEQVKKEDMKISESENKKSTTTPQDSPSSVTTTPQTTGNASANTSTGSKSNSYPGSGAALVTPEVQKAIDDLKNIPTSCGYSQTYSYKMTRDTELAIENSMHESGLASYLPVRDNQEYYNSLVTAENQRHQSAVDRINATYDSIIANFRATHNCI